MSRFKLLLADAAVIMTLAWPLIINNLFSIGINTADTLMAGHLGTVQLAGVAIGSTIWITLFLFGLGVVMALSPTVAQHFGAGDLEDIGRDTRQGLWLASGVAIIVVIGMRSASPILVWASIEPDVITLAQGYLNAMSYGVPAAFFYHTLKQMSEGVGRTVPIMLVATASLPINVALNYIFMHGKLGAPALGAVGCGVGSGIAFWIMFLMLGVYTYKHEGYKPFKLWSQFDGPNSASLLRLLGIGLPIGLSLFLQGGLFSTLALLMGSLGTAVVAAHQVALNYSSLIFMVPLGMSMAITICVGQAIGRGEPATARRIGYTGIVLCVCLMCVTGLFTYLFAANIIELYTDDMAVRAIAVSILVIVVFLQLGDGAQVAAAGALRGLKDTRAPMYINGVIYWGIGFTTAYWLGITLGYGAQGIWVGLSVALWVAAVALTGRFTWVMRRNGAALTMPSVQSL